MAVQQEVTIESISKTKPLSVLSGKKVSQLTAPERNILLEAIGERLGLVVNGVVCVWAWLELLNDDPSVD